MILIWLICKIETYYGVEINKSWVNEIKLNGWWDKNQQNQ